MILKVDLNQEMWEWNRDSRVPLFFPNWGWNQHGGMPISEAISEGSLLHDQPVMTICSNSSWTSLDFVKNCCQRACFASQTYCFVDLFLGRITTGQQDISDVTIQRLQPPKRHRKVRKQENMKDHPKNFFHHLFWGLLLFGNLTWGIPWARGWQSQSFECENDL